MGFAYVKPVKKYPEVRGTYLSGLKRATSATRKASPGASNVKALQTHPRSEFCGECGVHIVARSPKAPGGVIVKVGTLDEPSIFEGPDMVFWTQHKKPFHLIPDGVAAFTTLPES